MISGQMPHQTDQGEMLWAKFQKLPQPCPPVELGDFLAILKFGVQHEGWASLDMGAQELPMVAASPSEYLHG